MLIILRAEDETRGRQRVRSRNTCVSRISNYSLKYFFVWFSGVCVKFCQFWFNPVNVIQTQQLKKGLKKFNFHDFTLSHLDRGWLIVNKITNCLATETGSVLWNSWNCCETNVVKGTSGRGRSSKNGGKLLCKYNLSDWTCTNAFLDIKLRVT